MVLHAAYVNISELDLERARVPGGSSGRRRDWCTVAMHYAMIWYV